MFDFETFLSKKIIKKDKQYFITILNKILYTDLQLVSIGFKSTEWVFVFFAWILRRVFVYCKLNYNSQVFSYEDTTT